MAGQRLSTPEPKIRHIQRFAGLLPIVICISREPSHLFADNARVERIDLTKLDFVVMSLRHGDHMAGLSYLLRVNPKVVIYAPKEGFGVYGGDLPSSFYRKDPFLPPDKRYYDGAPPAIMRFGSAWPDANFQLVDKNARIVDKLHGNRDELMTNAR